MVRGIVFFMLVWIFVAIFIATYGHLSSTEQLSVKRAGLYGLFTAIVASIIVGVMIFVF